MSAATTTTGAPAAGWYPDPHGSEDLRWWDGRAWTSHTTAAPEPEPVADPDPVSHLALLSSFDWFSQPDPEPLVPAEPSHFYAALGPEPEPEPEPELLVEPEPELLLEPVAESEPEPVAPGPFVFRARALDRERELFEAVVPARYEGPMATIASPVVLRVAEPAAVASPAIEAPEPEPETEAPAADTVEIPAVRSWRPRRRFALAGTGAIAALAATAALATNLLADDDSSKARAGAAAPALSVAERACLKEWNTTAGGGAAQLRVTLGQFEGALAKVGPVKPLPGTVMSADSCALTVYDPGTDTHATFIAGVKDTVGYQDATSYPRASTYGWPRTARQANVSIGSDGTIRSY